MRKEIPAPTGEIEKVLKNFFLLAGSYREILSASILTDLVEDTVEFRLRLAHRSGGTTSEDSQEKEEVDVQKA